ncbi:non-ribosomal peptide synthetase [Actinocrispum wychmicini]|uniref:Amino acid adenylation domain-containing protein n=1 Tax=Actinocrispum wychmicini TaxID=1213861 RepID=A0A4R2JL98_9PSEU|nr:non-ribosomal peptide synthetase [Actinocrispum wychmicini]TCO59352.1 amino acid adenylation domain-containing protein [Actinocrispum wychmicini]
MSMAGNPTPDRLTAVLSGNGTARPTLVRQSRPVLIPLSPTQRQLWILDTVAGGAERAPAAYNIPLALRLSGRLNSAALRSALGDVVTRHEVLRTVFPATESGITYLAYQVILSTFRPALPVTDISPEGLDEALATEAVRRFDLTAEPPIRCHLFTVSPDEHVLLMTIHHIAMDGWSCGPLAADLALAYTARSQGREPSFEPLAAQFADYVLWHQRVMGDERDAGSLAGSQLAFWRRALAGLPDQLELPTDRPRPAEASRRGSTVPIRLDAALHTRLTQLARSTKTSLFMVLQAGLAAMLTRLGAGTDIPLGCQVAGRGDVALADMVGCFLNTLVLRTDTSGDPAFTELLDRIRKSDLAAYANADLPFDRVVGAVNPTRSLARHPLFQIMLVLQNTSVQQFTLPGIEVTQQYVHTAGARFDMMIDFREEPGGGLGGVVEYASDLYDQVSVECFAARLVRLLRAFAADPSLAIGRPALLEPAELERMAAAWHGTDVDVELVPVQRQFDAQARRTPGGLAVACRDRELSYAELNARADDLARRIAARGVGPEKLVAVCVPRSEWLVVALLAVLKAGGAYLPIDPDYPPDRIAFILDDAAPLLALATSATATGLAKGKVPCLLLDADLAGDKQTSDGKETDSGTVTQVLPAAPAYVIYTSGSTGRPKGVVISHGALINFLGAMGERFPLKYTDRWLAVTTIAFDISNLELWLPLISGAGVVLADRDIVYDPVALSAVVKSAGVTIMQATPALWQSQFGVDPDGVMGLRMLVGGEALPSALARAMAGRAAEVANLYGPTETTIWSTTAAVPPTVGHISIGRPIWNTRVYVLDAGLQPLPSGVAGELYIAGVGLARGYLNRAALTAERFVADPFGPPGSRMYRTGDIARWQADGTLGYIGRVDHQVKVRGFRIELGEVENILATHERVAQAAVVVREDRPGDKRLVGYVVPAVPDGAAAAPLDPVGLRAFAGEMLPGYMVPGSIVVLDTLPLTPNGKLDRGALPAPELPDATSHRSPTSGTEELLCRLFAQVLGLTDVGADVGFFDLGGHSLAAIRLVSAARKAGLPLKVRDVFAHQSVGRLARAVSGRSGEQEPVQRAESGPLMRSRRWDR